LATNCTTLVTTLKVSKLLIDGDSLVYRCGFACEKTKYLVDYPHGMRYSYFDTAKDANEAAKDGGSIWTRKEYEPLDYCLATVKNSINKIGNRFDFEACEIWLSPSVGNFRDRIATRAKYKGNRDTSQRPKWYREIIDYLRNYHGAQTAVGMEADDALAMGMVATPESVCVSLDKDLLQVPGLHYNWVSEELKKVGKKQAAFNFYTQVLTGDPSDNIPGIDGVGPQTAQRLLEGATSPKELWQRTERAYIEKYGVNGTSYAVETARLVYLLRKEGDEWSPPQ